MVLSLRFGWQLSLRMRMECFMWSYLSSVKTPGRLLLNQTRPCTFCCATLRLGILSPIISNRMYQSLGPKVTVYESSRTILAASNSQLGPLAGYDSNYSELPIFEC